MPPLLIKERLAILREDQFDEAFKNHCRHICFGQGHFKNITIQNERGLFLALVLCNEFSQASDKSAQDGAG